VVDRLKTRLQQARFILWRDVSYFQKMPRSRSVALLRGAVVNAALAMLEAKRLTVSDDRRLGVEFERNLVRTGEVGEDYLEILLDILRVTAAPAEEHSPVGRDVVFQALVEDARAFGAMAEGYLTEAERAPGGARYDFATPDESPEFDIELARLFAGAARRRS
jgi:hypothetical protein